MISSHKKILVVFALLFLFVGLCTVGCRKKVKPGCVNTDSMPGKTFSQYVKHDEKGNTTIVYLGPENKTPEVNFGPSDVSFEFSELR